MKILFWFRKCVDENMLSQNQAQILTMLFPILEQLCIHAFLLMLFSFFLLFFFFDFPQLCFHPQWCKKSENFLWVKERVSRTGIAQITSLLLKNVQMQQRQKMSRLWIDCCHCFVLSLSHTRCILSRFSLLRKWLSCYSCLIAHREKEDDSLLEVTKDLFWKRLAKWYSNKHLVWSENDEESQFQPDTMACFSS